MTDKIKLPLKTLEVLDSEPVEIQNPFSKVIANTLILVATNVILFIFFVI